MAEWKTVLGRDLRPLRLFTADEFHQYLKALPLEERVAIEDAVVLDDEVRVDFGNELLHAKEARVIFQRCTFSRGVQVIGLSWPDMDENAPERTEKAPRVSLEECLCGPYLGLEGRFESIQIDGCAADHAGFEYGDSGEHFEVDTLEIFNSKFNSLDLSGNVLLHLSLTLQVEYLSFALEYGQDDFGEVEIVVSESITVHDGWPEWFHYFRGLCPNISIRYTGKRSDLLGA